MADNTGLQFTFTVDQLPASSFIVTEFSGQEHASCPFIFDLKLASQQEDITPQQVVDKTACLTIWQDGVPQRHINGVVSSLEQGDTGYHHSIYRVSLVASLKRLELRQNSRIFQQLDAAEIISILLQEMGIEDYAFSVKQALQKREYCVQYRETDLAFLDRLAAEEGLFYYFIHHKDKHELIFADDSQTLFTLAKPIIYNANSGGASKQLAINSFQSNNQITSANVALQDYSFKKPNYSFLQTQQGQELDFQRQDYQHFDFPGRYKNDHSGQKYAATRQHWLNRNSTTASIISNHPTLTAGIKFDLREHPNPAHNRDWQLINVAHQGEQHQALEQAGGQGQTRYQNQATLLPGHRQWKATANVKPCVDGPQIAIVTGPEGEEIYCDEHGRVKVQFPWDRYSDNDDKASCWIRVAQGWAGSQYGSMAIPRIGHEVIVNFVEGDPDQPIITGRTYHANNRPPYTLPDHKTRTVFRTETHQGEGYNELRIEDESGQEEIFWHAQKDFNQLIENDQAIQIKRDNHSHVERDQLSHIKGNNHTTVNGTHHNQVKGQQSLVINGSLHIKAGQAWLTDAGQALHCKAGDKIVLEAGAEITIKAGSSFVKVDPAGVHLSGPAVNMNSGGSASAAASFAGETAKKPIEVEQATTLNVEQVTATSASLTAPEAKMKATQAGEIAIEAAIEPETITPEFHTAVGSKPSAPKAVNSSQTTKAPATSATPELPPQSPLKSQPDEPKDEKPKPTKPFIFSL
ncbi:type VI secretion system Vgr family protein [Motilimonas pumila]|uniref:Type VI secretion system tip protein VgrG n=1 Tax=Motilimonas pumila TaxID=2303987 RepID=A0A418YD78_9GAMM|nr:type VI secretion system tip protein TssI/VgrG [Motilimonas pumila]RJG42496.1 type VI secretion system tip protein VgrG [Motilimonas pumila]